MEENNSLKVIIFSTQHGGHGILAIEKLLSSGFLLIIYMLLRKIMLKMKC